MTDSGSSPADEVVADEEHKDYEYHHVTHPPIMPRLAHILNPLHTAGKKSPS